MLYELLHIILIFLSFPYQLNFFAFSVWKKLNHGSNEKVESVRCSDCGVFFFWGGAREDEYLPAEREIVALTHLVFEVKRGTAAFQAPPLQEGDAVAQHLGFVQVVGGHDDGAVWRKHRTISGIPFNACWIWVCVWMNEVWFWLLLDLSLRNPPPPPDSQDTGMSASGNYDIFFLVTFPNRVGFHVSPTRVGARVHAITHSEFNNQSLVIGTAYRTK